MKLLLFFLLIAASEAATELPVLDVTARAEYPAEESPGTVLDADILSSLASTGGDYEEFLAMVPGAYSGNPVGGNFSLRGTGQDTVFSFFNMGSNPLIAVLEDGIPLSPATLRYLPPPLWGLAGADVRKGPQIHLSASNASSGALLLRSAAPSHDWGGELFTEVGEHGLFRSGLSQDLSLIPGELALRIATYHEESDGHETNRFNDNHFYGATDRDRFESRLRWTPSGASGAIIDLSILNDQSRGNPFALVKEAVEGGLFARETTANTPYEYPADRWAASILADLPLAENLRLISTTGVQRLDVELRRDLDGSALLNWTADGFIDEARFTQHFSLEGEKEHLNWSVGAYFERSDYDTGNKGVGGFPLPFGRPYDTTDSEDVRIAALDARLDWEFREKWHLIGGLRLNHEVREVTATSIFGAGPLISNSQKVTDDAVIPQLATEWRPDDQTMTGLRISRPYRAAGISYATTLGTVQAYDPEDGFEVEWYAKTQWRSLTLGTAVFHSWLDDIQVPYYAPGGFPGIDTLVANSGQARRYGAEMEARWQADSMFSFFGTLAWIHQRFDELTIGGMDFSGQAFPNAPEWIAGIGGDFHHPSGVFASMIFSYASSTYSAADHAESTRLEDRELLSAKLGYAWKNARVYLFGTNLLDDEYAQVRLDNTSSGFSLSGKAGPPRTIGIGLNLNW